MKAIRISRFGGPEVMEYLDVPDPVPERGQVLVRLHAAGVNPVEAYIREGKYMKLPPLPFTPGADGAGIIEESGTLPVGSRVFVTSSVTGAYAEKAVCAAEDVYPLSDRMTFAQGAALGVPYGTATWALFYRGQAKRGETVLIHGASGGVGTAAVQLARAAGLRVFGTAGTPEGLELVKRNGAEAAFNHKEPDYLDKIKGAAGDHGLDMIIEMAAHHNLGKDLPLLAKSGRVVVIGSRGPVEIDARNLMGREADIRGITFFSPGAELRAEIYSRISAGIADGSLNPIVGTAIPLGEAGRAHQHIMTSSALGKLVLTM
ncbi:MAG TPA: NADPH:quinone reductase [Chthoniobacteraceae bacterium]|jgi:NADPH2:quinone reductase|nr:NADPH:quinone reductase [Chthoniobacteraceae bacterium]